MPELIRRVLGRVSDKLTKQSKNVEQPPSLETPSNSTTAPSVRNPEIEHDIKIATAVGASGDTPSQNPFESKPKAESLPERDQDVKPKGLWDQAYALISEEHPDILEAYERYLLSDNAPERSKIDQSISQNAQDREKQLRELAEKKLSAVQEGHLKVTIHGKQIIVQEQIHRVIRNVLASKDLIGAVLATEPHGSIAWAGVLLVLPLITNPITQADDATGLLGYISELLVRLQLIENTHQLTSTNSVCRNARIREHLRKEIVAMYTQIITSEMRMACQYSRSTLHRFWRDLSKEDDWGSLLSDMKKKKQSIDEDLQAIGDNALHHVDDEVSTLQEKADDMIRKLDTIAYELNLAKLPSAPHASYNATDPSANSLPRMCLEDTRVEILDYIERWGKRDDEKQIFWLNGMAGTGKSTIARTVAERFNQQGLLGASFFFSRNGESRDSIYTIFPTLASQLATVLPELRPFISKAIDQYGEIGSKWPRDQWNRLIMGPLTDLDKALLLPLHLIFVIDALDECRNHEQLALPELLLTVTRLRRINVRILITSRPHTTIVKHFQQVSDNFDNYRLDSDEETHQTTQDISTYLKSELRHLAFKNDWEAGWPGEEQIQELVQRAGRLFIYASTACRYLDSKFPEERLSSILSAHSTGKSPTADLDQMYQVVLQQSISGNSDSDMLIPLFRQIVGSLILLHENLSAHDISLLLGVPLRRVQIVLDNLRSVLLVPDEVTSPIAIFHLSFHDFLLDSSRCTDHNVHIEERSAQAHLTRRCLNLMGCQLHKDICDLRHPGTLKKEIDLLLVQKHIHVVLQYACRFWVTHLVRSDINLDKDQCIYEFLCTHVLHWLEALAIIKKVSEGVLQIIALEEHLKCAGNQPLQDVVYDTKRFLLYIRASIEEAPLQIYCAGLIFTPHRSPVRNRFLSEQPRWVEQLPRVDTDWSALVQTLPHEDTVSDVVTSADGRLLGSSCENGSLFLWDTITGQQLKAFVIESTRDSPGPEPDDTTSTLDSTSKRDTAKAIEFLENDSKLGAVTTSGDVSVWDIATGERVQHTQHPFVQGPLERAAISRNKIVVVKSEMNKDVVVLDLTTGKLHLIRVDDTLRDMAISADGTRLVLLQTYSMRIYNIKQGTIVRQAELTWSMFDDPYDLVSSVALSSDGMKLAFRNWNQQVFLVDIAANKRETLPPENLLESPHKDGVSIWDVRSKADTGPTYLVKYLSKVRFSDNLKPISHIGECINLWDPNTNMSQSPNSPNDHGWEFSLPCPITLNGRMAVTKNYPLRLWDIEKCETVELHIPRCHIAELSLHLYRGRRIWSTTALTAEGDAIACARKDIIALWDIARKTDARTIRTNKETATALTFAPDNRALASAHRSRDGYLEIGLWDPCLHQGGKTIRVSETFTVREMSFSPDGKKLALLFSSIAQIWDLSTEKRILALCHDGERHGELNDLLFRGQDLSLQFSPDGEVLAIGSKYTIRTFDTSTGHLLQELTGHYTSVYGLVFSPEKIVQSGIWDIKDDWFVKDGERIIYLPAEYRPSNILEDMWIRGDLVLWKVEERGVLIFRFHFDTGRKIEV